MISHVTPGSTPGAARQPENATASDSEDTIRNLKASQSVEAAFLAQRIPTPPAEVAAIITNQVKSAIKNLPLNEVRNMTPGSGALGATAIAGVDQYLSMLTPAQRQDATIGVNSLDSSAMLRLNANLRAMGAADRGETGHGPSSGARYEISGLTLSPSEKLTQNYAIQQGVMWAADNREILKLGTAAIDIIKQTQLRKDTYDGLTKEAGLSAKGAVGIAKMAKDRGEDANEAGKEVTDCLKTLNDPSVRKAVDDRAKLELDSKATAEQKAAADKGVETSVDEHVEAQPGHAGHGERLKKRLGIATEKKAEAKIENKAEASATAKEVSKKNSMRSAAQAARNDF